MINHFLEIIEVKPYDRCTCGCGGTAPDSKKASNDRTFDMAWGIVKGSNCATHNCEDNSAEKDWSYCGKNDCSSCGDTCEDANCRKCNPDEKW